MTMNPNTRISDLQTPGKPEPRDRGPLALLAVGVALVWAVVARVLYR